jgi:hypothetical protein
LVEKWQTALLIAKPKRKASESSIISDTSNCIYGYYCILCYFLQAFKIHTFNAPQSKITLAERKREKACGWLK